VQAYQKRARAVIDWLIALGRRQDRRLMVRLVKGAYWDTEIKRTQVDGLPDYPVFTRKVHTDVSYLACAKAMLAAPDALYPQFASHNAFTIAAVHTLAGDADYEFQCLHGMGESVYDQVVGNDRLRPHSRERGGPYCRIYAPVGSHETLLAYLVRRLLENGANTSFVNRIVDPAVDIAELVADPVARARSTGGSPHPRIPLPAALYPDRGNSRGLDLSDEAVLRDLELQLAAEPPRYAAAPILASAVDRASRATIAIVNPADHRDVIGEVEEADAADVAHAVAIAAAPENAWSASKRPNAPTVSTARRSARGRATDSCCSRYAKRARPSPNAVGEVREAADFCRYYAAQARRELGGTTPRGPMACIAPWNFPLAIFAGQNQRGARRRQPGAREAGRADAADRGEAVRIFIGRHSAGRAAAVAGPRRNRRRRARRRSAHRGRAVHRIDRVAAAHQSHARRPRRRPGADRRDRRPERDDRRQLRVARAGRSPTR
jgi:RHH-type proline utilization regulon transcriptional repressor/proline dehydrogenase/delta 1-pyrroline-5-carboxylate dehydrogenase